MPQSFSSIQGLRANCFRESPPFTQILGPGSLKKVVLAFSSVFLVETFYVPWYIIFKKRKFTSLLMRLGTPSSSMCPSYVRSKVPPGHHRTGRGSGFSLCRSPKKKLNWVEKCFDFIYTPEGLSVTFNTASLIPTSCDIFWKAAGNSAPHGKPSV